MKCSICGEDKASTYDRPITLGGLGQAKTKPICDECYLKKFTDKNEKNS